MYRCDKYNLLPAFEKMLSTWVFQFRLDDVVTPSILHVVTYIIPIYISYWI